MPWEAILKRSPAWLLAAALFVAVCVFAYSAATTTCFRYFGFPFGQCEGVLPKGAVMAFDLSTGCPEDSQAVDEFKGRFILGAGQGRGLQDRPFRTPGGEEGHALTL